MTAEWIERALDLIGEGKSFAVVTVCAIEGSAPREAGAKMIVTHDRQWGTIGGGALEFTAAARGRALLEEPKDAFLFEEFPLGPALGQCCGGRVLLSYERFDARDRDWLRQAHGALSENETAIVERSVPDGAWRIVENAREAENRAVILFGGDGAAFVETIPQPEAITRIRETISDQRISVYLFGAGHVGKAIAQCLSMLPVSLTWVDRREDSFPEGARAGANFIRTDEETDIAAAARAGACFFVMTHSHQLDYDLVQKILERGDGAYCGLIGSKTKRARFEKRLRRAGLSEAQLKRLYCPIGAGGLESKLPSVIALAAVHEMLLAHESYKKGRP